MPSGKLSRSQRNEGAGMAPTGNTEKEVHDFTKHPKPCSSLKIASFVS